MLSCRVLSLMDRFPKPCVAGSNPAGATSQIPRKSRVFAYIDFLCIVVKILDTAGNFVSRMTRVTVDC